MVSEVDLDGDGEISFDEFATGTGMGKAQGAPRDVVASLQR